MKLCQLIALYRLDRNCHGGGVLIAVLNKNTSIACPQYGRANIELLWRNGALIGGTQEIQGDDKILQTLLV